MLQPIKIQKLSNGQFCNVKQFIDDFLTNYKKNIAFPRINTLHDQAHNTLRDMIDQRGAYLSAIKIFIHSGSTTIISTTDRLPQVNCIRCNGLISVYAQGYHGDDGKLDYYDRIVNEVELVIEEQRNICDKLDATEI